LLLLFQGPQDAAEQSQGLAADVFAEPQGVAAVEDELLASEDVAFQVAALDALVLACSFEGGVDLGEAVHDLVLGVVGVDVILVGERVFVAEGAGGVGTKEHVVL